MASCWSWCISSRQPRSDSEILEKKWLLCKFRQAEGLGRLTELPIFHCGVGETEQFSERHKYKQKMTDLKGLRMQEWKLLVSNSVGTWAINIEYPRSAPAQSLSTSPKIGTLGSPPHQLIQTQSQGNKETKIAWDYIFPNSTNQSSK